MTSEKVKEKETEKETKKETKKENKQEKGNEKQVTYTGYEDLINQAAPPQYVRPRMQRQQRAAQFMPFAALVGHEEALALEREVTEEWQEQSEDILHDLDAVARDIEAALSRGDTPVVQITYFAPHPQKAGGHYVTQCLIVSKLDSWQRVVYGYADNDSEDRRQISFDRITSLHIQSP